jgi:hypothetical protein
LPSFPRPPLTQEWECRYLLSKARRLRDATATLQLVSQASNATTTTRNTQAPAYVASRVGEGTALPEVGVEGGQREGEGGAVVRHVVEGLSTELCKVLMEGVMGV